MTTKNVRYIDAASSRRTELQAKGLTEEQIEAVLNAEAFRKLPIDQRINYVMDSVGTMQRVFREALENIAEEMVALHANQESLADAFDINLRGLEKMLVGLGVTEATQKEIMEKVTQEFLTEQAAREKAVLDLEGKVMEDELHKANSESTKSLVVE